MSIIITTPEDLQKLIDDSINKAFSRLAPDLHKQSQASASSEPPLSVLQACRELSVSRPTLDNWESKKLIKCHRIGRRKYYLRSELLNIKDEGKHTISLTNGLKES